MKDAYGNTPEQLEAAQRWLDNARRCHDTHKPNFAPCEYCRKPQLDLLFTSATGAAQAPGVAGEKK